MENNLSTRRPHQNKIAETIATFFDYARARNFHAAINFSYLALLFSPNSIKHILKGIDKIAAKKN